jgi:hypothetical protein
MAASVGRKVKDAIVWFHGIGRLVPSRARRRAGPELSEPMVTTLILILGGVLLAAIGRDILLHGTTEAAQKIRRRPRSHGSATMSKRIDVPSLFNSLRAECAGLRRTEVAARKKREMSKQSIREGTEGSALPARAD